MHMPPSLLQVAPRVEGNGFCQPHTAALNLREQQLLRDRRAQLHLAVDRVHQALDPHERRDAVDVVPQPVRASVEEPRHDGSALELDRHRKRGTTVVVIVRVEARPDALPGLPFHLTRREEKVDDFDVPPARREHQRVPPQLPLHVHVRALADVELDDVKVAPSRGVEKRRAPRLVPVLEIGHLLHQRVDDVPPPRDGRVHERRHAANVARLDVRPVVDEGVHHVDRAALAGENQRGGLVVRRHGVHVGTNIDERLHHREVTAPRRDHERREAEGVSVVHDAVELIGVLICEKLELL